MMIAITRWMLNVLVSLSLVLPLSGCWNSRELNDLSIVSGIGIDKADDKDEYRVTFQVVNPTSTATSTGASTGQPPITIYTSTDRTIFGALRKTSRKSSRQLFFAHTQLVVIGEALARSGINDIFDIFERSHELRLNSAILVSRNSNAASILKVLIPVESLPAIGLVKKSRNTSRLWGENREVNIFETIKGITGESELVLSGIQLTGDPEEGKKKTNLEQTEVKTLTMMKGLAVFKDGKLVDWMEGPAARGTQWVLNQLKTTTINIDSGEQKESVAVDVTFSKTKVAIELRQGLPVFHIRISEEGSLSETKAPVDFSKRDVILDLEKEMAKETQEEVKQAIQTAQRFGSDIFGFADQLKRTKPNVWKGVENDWDTLFAKGQADIQVEAYIRSTGMRIKSYLIKPE
ncbi:Ger(x)C family spore germination protein [Paenibacillus sp. sgz500958]|uniref:Ger(x)C family spore germination protein n=1 Tax=Paenibacillus sp. sgz500958 TaxID=3242475 RepID=UPI0036D2564F